MKKNVSGQKVGCQMVSATDGSAFTGSVTVYVTGDAGTQAAGSVGSGACTHEGNGYHTYAPAQAETNYDLIAFTFVGTGAVPATVQVYPIPTTGILAPTVADRTLDVSATGEAGIDWANVGSPTTSVNLSGTTVNLVNTATTVTNQLTAAQIATGVWQDSTAGDFTVASSIGKALYVANIAPGASGGHMISGSNAGTTTFGALTVTGATTLTGNVSMAAGLNITQSSSNTSALVITGNGTGHGIAVTSGSGATGDGIRSTAASTNGNAMNLVGVGTGAGLLATGGATGHGISGVGGATSGNGMRLAGTAGNSIAFNILGQGSAAGMSCTGGATGPGASFVGGATSGNSINQSVTSGNAYIAANITHFGGTAGTFASGRPEVNATHWGGTAVASATVRADLINIAGVAVSTSTAQLGVNVVNAGGTAWASGSLTSGVFAAGAINAAAIAADAIGASELAADAVAEIADAVWDEVLSGHLTAGSTGNALNAAGSAGDPWSTSLPGAYGAGSAGYIIGTNLNATVSSRAASSSLPTNFSALAITAGGIVQADLQTIKTQTVTCSGGVTIPAATLASTTNITAGTITTVSGNVTGSVGSVVAQVVADLQGINGIGGNNVAGLSQLGSAYYAGTLTTNVTGNITGNLSGSVASVTGNVGGNVVGSVASVTGNVGGNVVGSVSSVTGAVGSVTGTIGGLSAAALADFFDTNSGTNYASAVAGSVVKEIADNAGGSGLTAGAIADAVWDEAISGHLTSGTTGAKLNSAAAAGDPLSNEVPGSYAGGTAGYVLGQIGSGTVTFSGPVIDDDDTFEVIQGDDYLIVDSRSLNWTFGASPNLTGATVVMRIQTPTVTELAGTKSGEGTSAQLVKFEMTKTLTASFYVKSYAFDIQATLSDGSVITLARSTFLVRSQVA